MKKSRRLWRALLFIFLITALCGNFALPVVNVSALPQLPAISHLVISQVYGGGGNNGAAYQSDFVEIFNPSDNSVTVDGWSIQYASATGTSNFAANVTNISGPIAPGQYYLVKLATGATGQALPSADATGNIDMGATNGKVVLANTTTGLACNGSTTSCDPYLTNIVDLVGYGNANYSETNAAPAISSSLSDIRTTGGCTDTDNNSADFVSGTPSARNTGFGPIVACSAQVATPTPTATDTGTPTNTPTDTPTPTSTSTPSTVRSVIINEVAWGGTTTSTDEWFELYNTTGSDISLAGWHLTADDGNPDIALSGTITAADPYFVFAKNSLVFKNLTPDKIYSSGSFSNTGEILYLTDSFGNQVDTANLDGGAWPAGSATPAYQTMERKGNVADSATAWATYGGPGSSVQDRNGNPIQGTPGAANWIVSTPPTATPTSTTTVTPTGTAPASLSVLINEVAWSGTAANSNDEWIELRNPGASAINITGWKLYGDDNTSGKVGSPNITLSGTIPAGGYFLLERDQLATDVPADQVYSSGDLLNTGERLYLKDKSGVTIDTANLDGSSWPAGTATTTSTASIAYASMERVGTTGNQWVTYGGTVPIAHDRSGNGIKGTPGRGNWIGTTSVTTITLDSPDPSLVNQNVTVSVTVVGGNSTPTGTVSITGANTNCTLTLSSGFGSCLVKFSSVGSKTLTATYSGDGSHPASSDTEAHTVSTSTVYRTPTPIPAPPPQLIAINEFVPRPGHDWNHDGVVNVGDEYIELLNHGTVDVNLSGWRLDDEVNTGSDPYSLPAKVLKPGERVVFYGSETGLLLSDGGDAVRLLKPNGQLLDAYNYSIASYPDESFCRLPDNGGADDWNKYCYPTPGFQNSLSGNGTTGSKGISQDILCPIADTLPYDFVWAECDPFGNNIFRPSFWDATGWYDDKALPIDGKWIIFAD